MDEKIVTPQLMGYCECTAIKGNILMGGDIYGENCQIFEMDEFKKGLHNIKGVCDSVNNLHNTGHTGIGCSEVTIDNIDVQILPQKTIALLNGGNVCSMIK